MGVNFYVAERIDEITAEHKVVVLDYDETTIPNDLHHLAQVENLDDNVIWGLDPYDNTLIPAEKLPALADLCKSLLQAMPRYNPNPELAEFLKGLESLCRAAIRVGKPLLAVGD